MSCYTPTVKRALCFVIGLSLTGISFADEASDLKKHIQSEMNKASQCLLKKDVAGAEKILRANFDKNFVNTGTKGEKVTLDQQLNQMKVQMAAIKAMKKVDYKAVSVKVKGNKAEASETSELIMVIANPQTKKDMTIRQTSKGVSTLEKRAGKWQGSQALGWRLNKFS